jgi:hypothetical protein
MEKKLKAQEKQARRLERKKTAHIAEPVEPPIGSEEMTNE